jgi:two-component system response regulator
MKTNPNSLPHRILLVEDNPDDILLTQTAVEDSPLPIQLHVVEDGREALDFLEKNGKYAGSPRPHLILLDLNLPKMHGLRVLKTIKQDAELKTIPVVVLTTSTYEEDITNSYNEHANCYITKPVDLEEFTGMVRLIETFWFSIVTLPTQEE